MSVASWDEARAELRREVEALERRLRALRRELRAEAPLSGVLDVIECQAGEERVVVPLQRVERVVPAAHLAPLPEAPAWVVGLLNVHGALVPVLDVAVRIQRRAREMELDDMIVICSAREAKVGLLVQGVHGLCKLDSGAVTRPAEDVAQANYVLGSAVVAGRLVFLLDVDALTALPDVGGQGA